MSVRPFFVSFVLVVAQFATHTLRSHAQSADLAIDTLTETAIANQMVELRISADAKVLDAANPFDSDEIDLWVTITPPRGRAFKVPAFWYQDFDAGLKPVGAGEWRARFTPAQRGVWRAAAKRIGDTLVSDSVSIDVQPAAEPGRGFVRINPRNPRYFAYDNGDLYFPIGLNLGWATGQDQIVLQDYERWFDRLAANGGNIARIWMASWSFGLEWKDTGLGDYRARMKQAWLLDQVFKMAEKRGIAIMLCLLNHGAFSESVNPEWKDNPYNAVNGGMLKTPQDFVSDEAARALFKRRVRYIAARWSYSTSLFAWEWWNEVNWTPIADTDLRPWIKEMTEHLRQFDPYAHLVTNSHANAATTTLWRMPELSFAQEHDYSGNDPLTVLKTSYDRIGATIDKNAKPILMAEHGVSASGADAQLIARELVHFHNSIWSAPFLGYAGTGMYWWWDSLVDPRGLWGEYGRLAEFIRDVDIAALTPATLYAGQGAKASALRNRTVALVWVRQNEYDANEVMRAFEKAQREALKANKKLNDWQYQPAAAPSRTLTVTGLTKGNYVLGIFSPQSGKWLVQRPLTVLDGNAYVPLPEYSADLAVRLEKK